MALPLPFAMPLAPWSAAALAFWLMLGGVAQADPGFAPPMSGTKRIGDNPMAEATMFSLYNYNSCYQGTGPVSRVFCGMAGPVPVYARSATLDYWEPAAIVEVSCRNGYSMLEPGLAGRVSGNMGRVQTCTTKGSQWFHEVRVWSSSGLGWRDRLLILGDTLKSNTMQCSAEGTTGASKYPHGYGIKHDFTRTGSGPMGTYEVFISDLEEGWGKQTDLQSGLRDASTLPQPPAEECALGSPNVQACWGDPSQYHGWVTHPNRAVAAALVSYRAIQRGMQMGRLPIPRRDGWKMSMDYPFVRSASPYAQTMGLSGGAEGFRHRGSECFQPGDPGPSWFNIGQNSALPDEIMRSLTAGDASQYAEQGAGIYIFTYWVRTGCKVFDRQFGSCQDEFFY